MVDAGPLPITRLAISLKDAPAVRDVLDTWWRHPHPQSHRLAQLERALNLHRLTRCRAEVPVVLCEDLEPYFFTLGALPRLPGFTLNVPRESSKGSLNFQRPGMGCL